MQCLCQVNGTKVCEGFDTYSQEDVQSLTALLDCEQDNNCPPLYVGQQYAQFQFCTACAAQACSCIL